MSGKTETIEEFLARGGMIERPKPSFDPKRPISKTILPRKKTSSVPCGTLSKYSNQGCRCLKCKEALRLYTIEYNRRVRYKK